jgi:hypothetical protein
VMGDEEYLLEVASRAWSQRDTGGLYKEGASVCVNEYSYQGDA